MTVPKLRFPGFTDDWKTNKLSELLKQRTEHQKISDEAPLLAFSYAEGVINPEDKKSNKRDFIMTDKYNKIFSKTEKDDIIYNPANVIHGAIHRNKLGTGVVSPIYKIFICQDVSPKFIGERLHTDGFINEMTRYIEGTVVKLRTLSPAQFLQMSINCPDLIEEQEKIGNFLECIDNLLDLHQRKCDELQELKKSMLQKMFPKEGEKVPEIRFPGFTGDWEQRKLADSVLLRGRIGFRGYTQNDLVNKGEGAITFSPADIDEEGNVSLENNKYLSWEKYEESPEIKVRVGDILFTKTASIGKVGYVQNLREKATINPQFALLTPKEKSDGYFTFLSVRNNSFMKQVIGITGGSSVPTMSQEKLKELTFLVPSQDEQKQIGSYFRNLDNLITLHQRKYEELKELKKGLLQQMFC